MLDTVKYLAGVPGPSGFGSRTTADQVAEAAGDLRYITAVITGTAFVTVDFDYLPSFFFCLIFSV